VRIAILQNRILTRQVAAVIGRTAYMYNTVVFAES